MRNSDSQLVAAARRGDEAAYGELIRRHYGAVYAVAVSRIGDWAAAEDVAQETFLSAWRHLEQLRVPGLFAPWLRRIARNLALNWLRSAGFRKRLANHYQRELDTVTENGVPPELPRDEQHEVWGALRDLPPRVREVLVLFYLDERPVREIASALGISENAVKKRLQRGREGLREALESRWKEDARREGHGAAADARAEQIARGLAIGPAAPEIARSATDWALGQWLTREGAAIIARNSAAALKPALAGGTAMSGKQLAVGAVLLAILAASIYWFGGPGSGSRQPDDATADGASGRETIAQQSDNPGADEPEPAEPRLPFELNSNGPDAIGEIPSEGDAELTGDIDRYALETPEEEDEAAVGSVTINGIVVDEWDAPVEGLDVFGFEERHTPDTELPSSTLGYIDDFAAHHQTLTGAGGTFSMLVPSDTDMVLLYAADDEYHGVARAFVEEGRETRIVVKSGVALVGRISDYDSRPVAGASVVSVAHVSSGSAIGGRSRFTITDEDGYFVLLFEKTGMVALRVLSTLHGEHIFMAVPIGEADPIELKLKPGAVLSGVVTYAGKGPAANLQVKAQSEIGMETGSAGVRVTGSAFATMTNAEGYYEFPSLATEVIYKVGVESADFKQKLATEVTLGPFSSGDAQTQDFELSDIITVQGRLVDAEGRPIEGAGIQARRLDDPSINGGANVEANGTFELTVAGDPGDYVFIPRYTHIPYEQMERFAPHVLRTVALRAGVNEDVDIIMDQAFSITWNIVDEFGNPIPDLSIGPNWHPEPNSAYGFGELGKTNADGIHHWSGYGPFGTYTFWLRKDGYLARETESYAGNPGERFDREHVVLYQPSSIEGQAVFDDGTPLTGGRLWISAFRSGERLAHVAVELAPDGYFAARDSIPATDVELEIRFDSDTAHADEPELWRSGSLHFAPNAFSDLGRISFVSPTSPDPAAP